MRRSHRVQQNDNRFNFWRVTAVKSPEQTRVEVVTKYNVGKIVLKSVNYNRTSSHSIKRQFHLTFNYLKGQEPSRLISSPKMKPSSNRTQVTSRNGKHPEKPFGCSVCGKRYTRKYTRDLHLKTHKGRKRQIRIGSTGEKSYQCKVCEKWFAKQGNLSAHLRSHRGEKTFSCAVCGKGFTYKRNLDKHLLSHNHKGEKVYHCTVCEKHFSLKKKLIEHVRIHDRRKPSRKDGSKSRLDTHHRIHAGHKPFHCTICGKGLSSKGNLSRHLRTHTKEKPFDCTICGRCFNLKDNLTRHLRVHTGEKPFKCTVCGRGFSVFANLQRHLRIHNKKKYHCSVCKKLFSCRESLNEHHHAKHDRKHPLECAHCGKCFKLQGHLTYHLRIHTGEKPFKCTVCGRGFSVNSNLRKHLRIHDKKKYLCTLCEKLFSCKKSLNAHRRCHEEKKPFECTVCGEGFSEKDKLNKHLHSHSDTRPDRHSVLDEMLTVNTTQGQVVTNAGEAIHQCSVCQRAFSSQDRLARHRSLHIRKRPFECTVNGNFFSDKDKRNKHPLPQSDARPAGSSVGNDRLTVNKPKSQIVTDTGDRMYQCLVCKREFSSEDRLARHRSLHTRQKPFQCTMCGERFSDRDRLDQHLHSHSDDRPDESSVRDYRLTVNAPKSQTVTDTDENLYQCSVCEREFSTEDRLARHRSLHKRKNPFQCTVCGKCFSDKDKLVQHVSSHADVRPNGYSVDDKLTVNAPQIQVVTGAGEAMYQCLVCEREFSTEDRLARHRSLHKRKNPFQCTVCGKCFSDKDKLDQHVPSHTDVRPNGYSVDDDKLTVNTPQIQVVTGAGEAMYQCLVCERKFSTEDRLARHSSLHNRKKLFECTVCGKLFSDKDTHNQHMHSHSEERSDESGVRNERLTVNVHPDQVVTDARETVYQCSQCEREFSTEDRLARHRSLHTGRKLYDRSRNLNG